MSPADMHSSNTHDQAIDATLIALREAASPPAGLEGRVLQKLAEQNGRTTRAGWHITWIAVPVGVCAALALTAIPVLRYPISSPGLRANNTPFSPGSVPISSPKPAETLLVREVPNVNPRSRHAHQIAIVRENHVPAAHPDTPPPPAPLTEQERLLLQIARSGDPSQRAMLSPEVLAREESDGDAEFRNFFAKSPTPPTTNP